MEELLERHGAPGPHAFSVLLAEAAAMVHGTDQEARGVVEMSWRDFSHYAGITRADVQTRLHELAGAPFELIVVENETELGFRVHLPRWSEWDRYPQDEQAAERAQKYRDRKRDERDTSR